MTATRPAPATIDWQDDLNDPLVRDYVDHVGFERLLRRLGIDQTTTVVLYGARLCAGAELRRQLDGVGQHSGAADRTVAPGAAPPGCPPGTLAAPGECRASS